MVSLQTEIEASAEATCNVELAQPPFVLDVPEVSATPRRVVPVYGPGASQDDHAPLSTPLQRQIPPRYRQMSAAELKMRIEAAKAKLGEKVVILGHHYQRDDIIQFADFRGDSFKLSQQAAARSGAQYIVFCGVHFMAESASILGQLHQRVVLPNMAAGCSMADMATYDDVLDCWEQLADFFGFDPNTEQPIETDQGGRHAVVPVTYMNSAAALKSFTGRNGGAVCTSSNAQKALTWAWQRGEKILFLPDQHLGRNTAVAMGVALDETVVWETGKPLGGNSPEALRRAKIILWQGYCSVHKRFSVEQIAQARQEHPGVRIVVHPECPLDVVQAADAAGSTEYIITYVENAPVGSTIGIGTEVNLVRRLAAEHPDKTIFCLDPVVCPCSTMYRIHPAYLAWVMEALADGQVLNEVRVDDETREWARVALDRMLSLV